MKLTEELKKKIDTAASEKEVKTILDGVKVGGGGRRHAIKPLMRG